MARLFRTDYDVEICDDRCCERDIYRFADLPYPLRDLLHRRPTFSILRWRSPDGSTWLIRPVLG
jgi:hypothetical protein